MRLGNVLIVVKDMERSIKFYHDLFGLDTVVDQDGNVILTDTSKLSENQIKAIAGIKEGKNGIELKLNDKEKALELLGRHLGMFKDKLEVTELEAEQTKLDDLIRQMRGGG